MSNETMRAEFETEFPCHEYVAWDEGVDAYYAANDSFEAMERADKQQARWEAWQAARAQSAEPATTQKGHVWNDVGERCLKCGDKDWFAPPECEADVTHPPAREQVPSGWQLVPVEPTDDMIDAGADASEAFRVDILRSYEAMLAAAPQPTAQPDTERLDWLDQQREDCVQEGPDGEPELYAHAWGIYEQADTIREAIDKNMTRPEPPEE